MNTVEVVTQQPSMEDQATASLIEQQRRNELHAATTHYLSLLSDRQQLPATVEEQASLQATLQQLASTFSLTHTS